MVRRVLCSWCGHCKRLAPIWSELATKLKDRKVNVAKVDATESVNRVFGRHFEIAGYPTIKFFKGDGTVRDYQGERTIPAFEEFQATGWKQVAGKSLPMELRFVNALFDSVLDFIITYVGPYEDWLSNHIGTVILVMTVLGIVTGFVLGRVTVMPTYIRVPVPMDHDIPTEDSAESTKEERRTRVKKRKGGKEH